MALEGGGYQAHHVPRRSFAIEGIALDLRLGTPSRLGEEIQEVIRHQPFRGGEATAPHLRRSNPRGHDAIARGAHGRDWQCINGNAD
jgi:hypothetical protein